MPAWEYDSDGRLLDDGRLESSYDQAGYIRERVTSSNSSAVQKFYQDGEGGLVKTVDTSSSVPAPGLTETLTTHRYSVRSSLVGEGMVFETKVKRVYNDPQQPPQTEQTATNDFVFFYALGNRVATYRESVHYTGNPSSPDTFLDFNLRTSFNQNNAKIFFENSGTSSNSGTADVNYFVSNGIELKSLKPGSAGRSAGVRWDTTGISQFAGGNCTVDGVFEFCENVSRLVGYEGNGGAVQCPDNSCGAAIATNVRTGEESLVAGFVATAGGDKGYWKDVWGSVDVCSENDKNGETCVPGLPGKIGKVWVEQKGDCYRDYKWLIRTHFKPELNKLWDDHVRQAEAEWNAGKSGQLGDERWIIVFADSARSSKKGRNLYLLYGSRRRK